MITNYNLQLQLLHPPSMCFPIIYHLCDICCMGTESTGTMLAANNITLHCLQLSTQYHGSRTVLALYPTIPHNTLMKYLWQSHANSITVHWQCSAWSNQLNQSIIDSGLCNVWSKHIYNAKDALTMGLTQSTSCLIMLMSELIILTKRKFCFPYFFYLITLQIKINYFSGSGEGINL